MARDKQRLKLQYAGMTSSPDDYLSPDGELMASFGLDDQSGAKVSAMKNGPKEISRMTVVNGAGIHEYSVIYIHKMEIKTIAMLKCVTRNEEGVSAIGYAWMDVTEGWKANPASSDMSDMVELVSLDVKDVKSIGNTIIVMTDTDIHYLVWKTGYGQTESGYKHLGTKLPMPHVTFGLQAEYCQYWDNHGIEGDNSEDAQQTQEESADQSMFEFTKQTIVLDSKGGIEYSVPEEDRAQFTTDVMSKVNKCVYEGTEKGWFMQPFLVRFALTMYDGSTTMASAPVYMPVCHPEGSHRIPSAFIEREKSSNPTDIFTKNKHFHIEYVKAALDYAISEESKQELQAWSDVIKGITVAVTSPIYTYNPGGIISDVTGGGNRITDLDFFYDNEEMRSVESIAKRIGVESSEYEKKGSYRYSDLSIYPKEYDFYTGGKSVGYPFRSIHLPEKGTSEYKEELERRSVFYVLKTIKTEDLSTERSIIKVRRGYLNTIETQLTLKDSYNAQDSISARFMYAYNGRLNLAGVKRSLWSGFKPSMLYAYQNNHGTPTDLQLTLVIEEGGETHIVKSASEPTRGIPYMLQYLFLPNTNVKDVWIVGSVYGDWFRYKKIQMKEHSGLNGSVYVGSIDEEINESDQEKDPSPESVGGVVEEKSKLYTSNALNPFVYEPSNINTIGNGRILGMAVAAKAISLGQAGHYPMYAMTEDGVWIMEVSETGGWRGKQAIMSDVCTVPEAIIETDGAVIMPTARGLIMIQGEQSLCVTDSNQSMVRIKVSDLPRLGDVVTGKWNIECQDVNRDIIVDIDDYIRSKDLRGVFDYKNQRIIYYRPDRDYSVVLTTGDRTMLYCQKWDIKSAPKSVNGCPVMIESGDNLYFADLSGAAYTIIGEDDNPIRLSNDALIITRPIKGTEIGMRDVRKQLDVLWHQGRYRRGSFDILLYGTEDYDRWHLIGQAKDATGLYGHHGQHWMAFVVVIYVKNMQEKDYIDCIDLTMTARLSQKSAAISGYK